MFIYMDVLIKSTEVAALLDTGSIVNNIFNEKLPPQKKIKFSVMRGTGSQIIQLAVVSEKL